MSEVLKHTEQLIEQANALNEQVQARLGEFEAFRHSELMQQFQLQVSGTVHAHADAHRDAHAMPGPGQGPQRTVQRIKNSQRLV